MNTKWNPTMSRRITLIVAALTVAACGTLQADNVPTVIVSEKKKQEKVVIDPEVTRNLAQLNERFAEIAKLWEAKDLEAARGEYRKLLAMTNAPAHYRSYARICASRRVMPRSRTRRQRRRNTRRSKRRRSILRCIATRRRKS